ncbi:MAG: M56 family metallopeptidase, partial [Hyphomonadaceae bacterium]
MTLLIWLAALSLAWGGVLWIAGRGLQRSTNVSGATRQWIWRGATVLLLAPWIAAPFVVMLGLGLAPAETSATAAMAGAPAAETLVAMQALDAANVETIVVSNGGSILAWFGQASLPELLISVFIAGWIVRFVAAQLALRSLLGIVNVSREAEPGITKSFVKVWAQRLKLRPAPRLRIVAEQHSPFSYGFLRPTICVPEGMEDKLSRGSLDLVVGHESLHIARGDGWLRPVERVTADILWFNPFAWLIRRELDVARDLAVDEAVLAMSDARVAYARTLRDVAGFAAG